MSMTVKNQTKVYIIQHLLNTIYDEIVVIILVNKNPPIWSFFSQIKLR